MHGTTTRRCPCRALADGLLLVAAIAGLVQFGGRVYAGAILSTGPTLKLRDVWRATTSPEASGTEAGTRPARKRQRLTRATSIHHHPPARR